jgi:hypothetical protein
MPPPPGSPVILHARSTLPENERISDLQLVFGHTFGDEALGPVIRRKKITG